MSYMCRFSTSVASNYMRGVRPKTTTNVKRMTTARENRRFLSLHLACRLFAAVTLGNQRLDQPTDRQKKKKWEQLRYLLFE